MCAILFQIRIYEHNFPNKKGHVEFIESSLKYLREFGVHEDLDTYKRLLNIMPKGPFVAKTKIQAGMMYFPKQQFAVLELLGKMQHHGTISQTSLKKVQKSFNYFYF